MTTTTTQPDSCEQIARELISTWMTKNNYPDARYQGQLREAIAAALQAAKQQGREEVIKNSIDLLGRGCERHVEIIRKQSFAEFRENYPACQWCLAEEVRTLQQQPKSESSRECEQIAKDLIEPYVLPYYGPEESKLEDRVVKVLQAKQDEMAALREEVLGVIEPFANIAATIAADDYGRALPNSQMVEAQLEYCRAALALRDKLKASQPTLPQQQTPHQ